MTVVQKAKPLQNVFKRLKRTTLLLPKHRSGIDYTLAVHGVTACVL